MKKQMPVSNIMTKELVVLDHKEELTTAEKLFKKHKIRHIPVVKEDCIIGMLSYTDLLRISFVDALGDGDNQVDTFVYNMFTLEQVMTKNVVSVKPNDSIKHVAEILVDKEFHALPVVENMKLQGIVTTTDLINYLLDQY